MLLYRRSTGRQDRSDHASERSDHASLLVLTILAGIAAMIDTVADDAYRETVSPWFRGIFTLQPDGGLMVGAPFVFQLHVVTAWLRVFGDLAVYAPRTRLERAGHLPRPRTDPLPAPPPVTERQTATRT